MPAVLDPNLFYDSQLENYDTSWELMAQPWASTGVETQEGNYKCSIVRGIIQETSFGVNISHEFASPDGLLSGIGSAVKGVTDIATSYSQAIGIGRGMVKDLGFGDKLTEIESGVDRALGATDLGSTLSNMMNSVKRGAVFMSAFDYIKVYKGSTHSIQLPSLSVRVWDGTALVDGVIKSNKEYLQILCERFIGGLQSVENHIDQVLGVQNPPNGYLPSFKVIDPQSPIKGTFGLRYGDHFIPNLLVTGISLRPSTFKVRKPVTTYETKHYISPRYPGKNLYQTSKAIRHADTAGISVEPDNYAYIDISLEIAPCTYVSRDLIQKILAMNGSTSQMFTITKTAEHNTYTASNGGSQSTQSGRE